MNAEKLTCDYKENVQCDITTVESIKTSDEMTITAIFRSTTDNKPSDDDELSSTWSTATQGPSSTISNFNLTSSTTSSNINTLNHTIPIESTSNEAVSTDSDFTKVTDISTSNYTVLTFSTGKDSNNITTVSIITKKPSIITTNTIPKNSTFTQVDPSIQERTNQKESTTMVSTETIASNDSTSVTKSTESEISASSPPSPTTEGFSNDITTVSITTERQTVGTTKTIPKNSTFTQIDPSIQERTNQKETTTMMPTETVTYHDSTWVTKPTRTESSTFKETTNDHITSETTLDFTTGTRDLSECPCISCTFEDSKDCTRYFECDSNATLLSHQCDAGQLFNKTTKQCDISANVACNIDTALCLHENEYFPVASSCEEYIQCFQKIPYRKSCPVGLSYNPSKRMCDWKTNVNCSDRHVGPLDPESRESLVECDCDSCSLPDSGDCSKYYLCLNKTTYVGYCSEGLFFNPTLSNCDLPDNVVCQNKTNLHCHSANGKFENPENCSLYFHCIGGNAYLRNCPAEQHFNNKTGSCDDICEAMCDKTVDCSTTNTETISDATVITKIQIKNTTKSEIDTTTTYSTAFHTSTAQQPTSTKITTTATTSSEENITTSEPTDISISKKVSDDATTFSTASSSVDFTTIVSITTTESEIGSTMSSSDFQTSSIEPPSSTKVVTSTTKSSEESTPASESSISVTDSVVTSSQIPNSCSGFDMTFPVPDDCASFYKCNYGQIGQPSIWNCREGLHFSRITHHCEFPCIAKCDTTLNCSTLTHLDARCPDYGFFPVMNDCSAFLNCAGEVAEMKKCPESLQYNSTSRTCDWPANVNCGEDPQSLTQFHADEECDCKFCVLPEQDCSKYRLCIGQKSYVLSCSSGLLFDERLGICIHKDAAQCFGEKPINKNLTTLPPKHIRCKAKNEMIRYPDNCNHFIHCSNWRPIIMDCPPGLHFSEKSQRCDYPCNAACDHSIKCPEKITVTEIPVSSTTDSILARVSKAEFSLTCPQLNGLFAYQKDCHRFISCSNGFPVLMDCPDTLEFDSNTKRCEWPRGRCASSTNSESFSQMSVSHGLECPRVNGTFTRPKNCHQFLHCNNGIPSIKNCPTPLHFNHLLGVCDWPHNVDCSRAASEKQLKCHQYNKKVQCPGNGNFLLPDHENCRSFLDCSYGRACIHYCPHGLEFNHNTLVCDLPSRVDCSRNHPKDAMHSDVPTFGPSKCPEPNGLFVSSKGCDKFLHCSNGQPALKTCPPPLMFNHILSICDWPHHVDCKRLLNVEKDSPVICHFGDKYVPDPKTNHCFYRCIMGTPVHGCCSRTKTFDKLRQKCI